MTHRLCHPQFMKSHYATDGGWRCWRPPRWPALFGDPRKAVHPITGRKIAPTMGIGGADWLERSDRESEEHPEAALDAVGSRRV